MLETAHPTSWFDRLWPRLATASGIGYVATAYMISRWLTRRCPAVLGMPTPWPHGAIESVACRTSDGILLKGWHIAPPLPRGAIALFHGMRLNRAAMLERIAFLAEAGYRCVAFDHRAHGESRGARTSFGYHERHDVAAVFDWIRARWPNEPCAALGVSMGAAALCFAAEVARGFDALILESVYADLTRAFEQRVGRGYPGWFQQFRPGILWFTEHRLGVRVPQISPISHIAHLAPRPVLLLTGGDDPHAPPDEVESLAAQIPATSRFHTIPGAGHQNVCSHGGSAYRALLLGFLAQHLPVRRISAAA